MPSLKNRKVVIDEITRYWLKITLKRNISEKEKNPTFLCTKYIRENIGHNMKIVYLYDKFSSKTL